MNFPKRVPVLANPQEGSSMRNVSSAVKILSLVDASMREPLLGTEDYSRSPANVTILFGSLIRFTLRNHRQGFPLVQERHTAGHRASATPSMGALWASPWCALFRFVELRIQDSLFQKQMD